MKKSNSLFFYFKNIKVFSLLFILSVVLSLFLVILPVGAYSTESTGLASYSFDNSQQTYAYVGGFNIFAFDNKLVFYDNNAVLIKEYNLPSLIGALYSVNCSRTVIMSIGDNINLLIANIQPCYSYGTVYTTPRIEWSYGLLNVNTLSFTSVSTSELNLGQTNNYVNYFSIGTGLILLKNINSTGSFFYYEFSYTGNLTYNGAGVPNAQISGYQFGSIGKLIGSTWTNVYYVKQSSTASTILYNNAIVVSSNEGMPADTAFIICSNNYQSSARANIYKVDFIAGTVGYIGVTSLDNTYVGSYVNNGYYSGFVYLLGVGTYENKVCVNFAGNTYTGDLLIVGTLIFNTTYVSQSVSTLGVNSPSFVNRIFSAGMPNGGSSGNISGIYTVAYFDDILTHTTDGYVWKDAGGRWILDQYGYYYATETGHIYYDLFGYKWVNASGSFPLTNIYVSSGIITSYPLTGWALTLSGIETATPIWATYQFPFLFTPQLPQSFPFSTSWSWAGFQPLGASIGLFVDSVRYNKCSANVMYAISSPVVLISKFYGDIFNGATIAFAPTEVKLLQGVTYTYTGNIYINTFLTGNGNYSVGITSLSTDSTTAFNSIPTSYISGTITNGVFSFTISPRVASSTVYQKLNINFTLTDGTIYSANYNFGFYQLGSTTYPLPSYDGGIGGGGNSVSFITGFLTNWQYMAILITYGVCCGLLTWKFAFTGLIAGLDIATVITFATGLLGGLMYPVLGLVIVANVALIITGSGLLNKRSNGTES
jgi:hypothetical protein